MATPKFPPCPPVLKPIQHYLKTASEHDNRDKVISYWCRLYALQAGLKIDRKSKEALTLLSALMDWLEMQKKDLNDNEAVSNELAAQAHVENYGLKLFLWADGEDRAGRFNKNVVKAFYTAGMLFDVLTTFGELNEEIENHRKYAKWKAAYIHNCLKNGETPIAGPLPTEEDEAASGEGNSEGNTEGGPDSYVPPENYVPPPMEDGSSLNVPTTEKDFSLPTPPRDPSPPLPVSMAPNPYRLAFDNAPHSLPVQPPSSAANVDYETRDYSHLAPQGGVVVKQADMAKAQKYCKWAASALNYEDVPTAIDNLQKALKLLQTGQDT